MKLTNPIHNYFYAFQSPKYYLDRAVLEGWDSEIGGIDYVLEINTPVVSAGKGTVKDIIHDFDQYGNCVIIDHGDGIETFYTNLERVFVTLGQKVFSDVLGFTSFDPNDYVSMLHFEVRKDGKCVTDTYKYLR
jgi:murein DD-endopeptidase MepM/ murein hydrolase activator NlpD